MIREDVGGGDKGRGKAQIEGRGWATPEEIDGFRGVHPSVELLQPEPAVRVLDRREDLDVLAALTAQVLEHAEVAEELASPAMMARRDPGAKILGW